MLFLLRLKIPASSLFRTCFALYPRQHLAFFHDAIVVPVSRKVNLQISLIGTVAGLSLRITQLTKEQVLAQHRNLGIADSLLDAALKKPTEKIFMKKNWGLETLLTVNGVRS